MKSSRPDPARPVLALAQHSLLQHHLPRLEQCLQQLSEEEIWWRPNQSSNSVGNLALHLAGNVRQWIVSGLGGAPDVRQRDQEFAERGPLSRAKLLQSLRAAVTEACRVLRRLTSRDLHRTYSIQKLRVTGLNAVLHVTEHFAFHTGQIVFITKLKRGEDLGFTRLPEEKPGSISPRNLPVL